MLTVYGRKTSANVQAVMWAIGELALDHERRDIGHKFGGNDTPDYLAMNPNGLVPVVRDDGGEPIFESAAIVRYLGARYGDEAFWPTDPARRAQLDKWAEWIKTTFGPVILMGIFTVLYRVKLEDRDPKAFKASEDQMARLSAMLDARLTDTDFMGGKDFTFADVMVGHLLYRYYTLDFERADRPALAAYYERLQGRSAFREHVMVDYSVLMDV